MNHISREEEPIEFRVHAPTADRVCLVLETDGGATTWLPMTPDGLGGWRLAHRVPQEGFRLRYFKQENRTWFNCGDHGLKRRPLTPMATVA
jgi:1,4-alpha-glucan branching enzyme